MKRTLDGWRGRVTAGALWLLGFIGLLGAQRTVGFVRDESVYFAAARSYASWFRLLASAPAEAFRDARIVQHFAFNHEHPALMKSLFGLSYALFHQTLGWTSAQTAFRLPALALAAAIPALLYLWGRNLFGAVAGLFAALAFFAVPRHLFNATLACFDMPIAAMWLIAVYAFRRALQNDRGWIGCGVAFGLALATKHNAFFLPVVLAPFALLRGRRGLASLLAMGVMGPVLFYALWPYLWHHPIDRIGWYLAFHAQHNHYAWFYLGDLLRQPPFPLAYVGVVTALTVPATLLMPMMLGLLSVVGRAFSRLRRPSWEEWLVVANAAASIAIISHPQVPHFGGVKHWLPSMPFLMLLAGCSVARVAAWVPFSSKRPRRWMRPAGISLLFGLLLGPAVVELTRVHPYGTSFYSETAGGLPGAANLGMQRQFWSSNVTGVLPWINAHASRGAGLYLHEVNGYSFRDYQENGWLRSDLRSAGPETAELAAYQYHQEFREQELEIWNAFGTERPVTGLYLDETPQVVVYRRP